MIGFPCAHCGKGLRAIDELAGKRVKCPQCGKVAPVPAEAPSAVPRTSSASGSVAAEVKTQPPRSAVAPSGHDAVTLAPGEASGGTDGQAGNANDLAGDTLALDGGALPLIAAFPAEWTQFLAPPQAADEIGRLGGYRILTVLGAGGMGVVFKAEDPHLKRPVALKAMLPGLALTDSARKRFHREAQAAAAIDHDHIVHIYQVGEDRGVPFIAMQFLQGEPLDARLKREHVLPVADVLRIGRETAEGLAAAHARGLIHRDIKPANIWLEMRAEAREARDEKKGAASSLGPRLSAHAPRVKILDFGLARMNAAGTQLTQQGAILGTPAYMAPEQATGEVVDERCDLFSLGCVLYRLCTGNLPFKGGDTVAILMAVSTERPRPPREVDPNVPPALSDLIMQLLEKKPALRPPSARSLVHALQAIESENTMHVSVAPAARAQAASRRTVRRWYWAAGAAGAAAVLLAVFFLLPGRDQKNPVTHSNPPHNSDWAALFNGKDLTGWKKHPDQTRGDWTITADGILEGRGGGNYLFSERGDYENFHLRVEAKISKGSNAGLFIRSPFGLGFDLRALGGQGKMPAGYEVEIVSPATDPDVPTGSIWRLTPEPDVAKAAQGSMEDNAWFVLEAIVQGTRLITKVNGQPAAERVDPAFKQGHIVLQVLSDPGMIQFRKIEIKDLPATASEDISPAKPCPADSLKRVDIPLELLKAAGDGDAVQAPRELVAIVRPLDAEKVNVAAVSPDGKWLALGSTLANPAWVSVLDLATAKESYRRSVSDKGKHFVADLAFSPDSKRLVTSTSAGLVQIWNAEDGMALGKGLTTAQAGVIYSLAFSPDNKTLAIARRGAVEPVRLFDLSTKAFEERPLPFTEEITALAFSPDGQTLAYGTAPMGKTGAALQFWDLTIAKKKVAVKDLAHSPVRMGFYPRGNKLVYTCAVTPECFVLDMTSRKIEKLDGPTGAAIFAVSRQGAVALAANKDSRIFVWNSTSELTKRQLNVGPADIVIRQVHFTPEGRHLVTVNSNGSVYILRLASPAGVPVAARPPDAPDPKNAPPLLKPGGLDLLKLIDLKPDAILGRWKLVDGKLHGQGAAEKGGYFLALPANPPSAYRLHLVVRRVKPGSLLLGISSGKARGVLTFRGTYTDLGIIDGKVYTTRMADKSKLHRENLTVGVPLYVIVTVRPKHIYVTANGDLIYSWKGDFLKQLSRWNNHPTNPLYVGGYDQGGFVFDEIVLEPLGRKAKPK